MNEIQTVNPNAVSTEVLLRDAVDSANKTIEDSYCSGSKRALERDIKYIAAWYTVNGLDFRESVRKEHVILYVMQHAEDMPQHVDKYLIDIGLKAKVGTHCIGTIQRKLAMWSHYLKMSGLPNPVYDKDVRYLIKNLKKKHGGSEAWGKAITLDVLEDMLKTCDDTLRGSRDRALLLFGFSTGGRRRGEISSSVVEYLTRHPDGNFTYNLKYSKTNQTGKDDLKPVAGRAAMALSVWLDRSHISEGAIFRGILKNGTKIVPSPLTDKQISNIIKHRVQLAGYDPVLYTAHSLRSGFVTEASKRRCPIGDVMAMTSHKSLSQVMQYYQPGNALNNSAAYLAG